MPLKVSLFVFLFVLLLLSSGSSCETFLSTGDAIGNFSTSGLTDLAAAVACTTEVFDVFEATLVVVAAVVDAEGFRGVSTVADVDDGLRDASAVVVFVSDLGSAFRAVLALATIPALCDLT